MSPPPRAVLLEPANGGLALARRLVRDGFHVTLLVTPAEEFMLRSRRVAGEVAPFGERGDAWLDALERVARGGETVVVTGADRASAFLARRRAELPRGVVAFEAADGAHLQLMDKTLADALARSAGVRVPWAAPVASAEEAEDAGAAAPYPCVLKPAFSHDWRAVHGLERVLVARDRSDFERYAERGLRHGLPMVANEYVPGGDDCVEEAIVVRSQSGAYPVTFEVRKIRQFPVGFGAASLCETADLPEPREMTRRLLDEAGFVGIAGVEFKRHPETGERFMLDVNVRLPTQWGVGDAAGAHASRRAIAVLRGEEPGEALEPRQGVKLIFPELEARAALARLKAAHGVGQRVGAARDLLRSYRGTRDAGVLDFRDPGPAMAHLAGVLRAARRGTDTR